MNAILHTLTELHGGEHDLAHELLATGDHHRTDHEVFHVARDIRRWSTEHAQRIADLTASSYDTILSPDHHTAQHLLGSIRHKTAEALGRQPQPGMLLLHDLSGIYLMASHNSLHWEMLAQAAQATRDTQLLELATRCHPQTLRQVRWANTLIKTQSAQILTSA